MPVCTTAARARDTFPDTSSPRKLYTEPKLPASKLPTSKFFVGSPAFFYRESAFYRINDFFPSESCQSQGQRPSVVVKIIDVFKLLRTRDKNEKDS